MFESPLEHFRVGLGVVARADQARDAEPGVADRLHRMIEHGFRERVDRDDRVFEWTPLELLLPHADCPEAGLGVPREVLLERPVERSHLADCAAGEERPSAGADHRRRHGSILGWRSQRL